MDKKLKQINNYRGTKQYHILTLTGSKCTDGINYIAENGYHWLISDLDPIIEDRFGDYEFLDISLDVDKKEIIITDGNDEILLRRKLDYVDKELISINFYYNHNVFLLRGEY